MLSHPRFSEGNVLKEDSDKYREEGRERGGGFENVFVAAEGSERHINF